MFIYYKYTPRMFVIKKPIRQFFHDFMEKHFIDFLKGRIGLYISPLYTNGNQYAQFTFDLDAKLDDLNRVIIEAKTLQKLFDCDFEIVTTRNGLHMISSTAYQLKTSIVNISHKLQEKLSKFKTIDWQGSIRVTPFGRLGCIEDGLYMNPVDKLTASNIKRLVKMAPHKIMSEEEWSVYFAKRLIPKFENLDIEIEVESII